MKNGTVAGKESVGPNQPLVMRMQPIANTSKIFSGMYQTFIRMPNIERVINDLRCPAVENSEYWFIMEWESTFWTPDKAIMQSWTLALTWNDEGWLIERSAVERGEDEGEPIHEFDDVVADDAGLATALQAAAEELAELMKALWLASAARTGS